MRGFSWCSMGASSMIHAEGGFRPMLFDLQTDLDEFHDFAKPDAHSAEINRLYGHLGEWGRRMSQRVTRSDHQIKASHGRSLRRGNLPFLKGETEVPDEMTAAYRGAIEQDCTAD